MLQQDSPDDYVISTGKTFTIRQFVEWTFKEIGIQIKWEGEGVDEIGIDTISGKILVEVSERYFRPSEVEVLCGDYTKARVKLNWEPKTSLMELIKIMLDYDLEKEAN